MRSRIGGLEPGAGGFQLLLAGEEHSRVRLVARLQRLACKRVVFVDLRLVFVGKTHGAGLFRHDACGLAFYLGEIVGHLTKILVDHLRRILRLVEQSVDVCLNDVVESG
ncbi:unknown [Clostridium sp. CAG:1024]|nr:unknown [Clostridium sp. CAG:1024]